MNYKDNGYKPRDDWIQASVCNDIKGKIPCGTDSTAAPPNTIIKEAIIMADYKTFQMKMYGDEDERLSRLAESANTDKTTFAKRRIFSDEDIIILDQSKYISRSLIEIGDNLRAAKRDGKLSDKLIEATYAKLCEISTKFTAVAKEVTDFKSGDSEEGED